MSGKAFVVGIIMGLIFGSLFGFGMGTPHDDGQERLEVAEICVTPFEEMNGSYIGYDNYLKADVPPNFVRCKYFNEEALETHYMIVKLKERWEVNDKGVKSDGKPW